MHNLRFFVIVGMEVGRLIIFPRLIKNCYLKCTVSLHVLQLYVGLITSEVNGSSFMDFSQCWTLAIKKKLQLMSSVDKVEHPHPQSAFLIASHLLSLSFDSRVLRKAGRSLRSTCNLEFHGLFLQWEGIT